MVERFDGRAQMSHPDHVARPGELDLPVEPVYGLTAGLPLKTLRRAVETAVQRLPILPEWLDPELMRRRTWPDWRSAVQQAHQPSSADQLDATHPARQRLAYDELLADQLALALVRGQTRRTGGAAIPAGGPLASGLAATLPFTLTAGQQIALAEIAADLAGDRRMSRLLQGDVGSGKTVVALAAMLQAVDAGFQAALMAPTELLARQHAATLAALAAPSGVGVAILTGREQGRPRAELLGRLADGRVPIVVGTHALLQDEVTFRNLGLVVVDEQHRFGVEQRVALAAKGRGVNVLAMTATPIPRSPDHGELRRHGFNTSDRQAGWTPADLDEAGLARPAGRGGAGDRASARRRPAGLLDLSFDRGIRNQRSRCRRLAPCHAVGGRRRARRPAAWPHEAAPSAISR